LARIGQANLPSLETLLKSSSGRLGSPDEIAKAVMFLASDESSDITETELFVNGGFAPVQRRR
jgi:NAD(P)-dependent dehydrogenase (short-subunit alcohol dehydrogenase family)